MQIVYEAFMQKGLMCAYEVFAALPHKEQEYEDNKWLQRTQSVLRSCP